MTCPACRRLVADIEAEQLRLIQEYTKTYTPDEPPAGPNWLVIGVGLHALAAALDRWLLTRKRGFTGMSPERRREVQSRGGHARAAARTRF